MINRDDWLSPAAFVARIDLDAKPVDKVVIKVQQHSPEMVKYTEQCCKCDPLGDQCICRELADRIHHAKISTQVHIRIPKDYSVMDGPELVMPAQIPDDRISLRKISVYEPSEDWMPC
jgi:hypothetical protein